MYYQLSIYPVWTGRFERCPGLRQRNGARERRSQPLMLKKAQISDHEKESRARTLMRAYGAMDVCGFGCSMRAIIRRTRMLKSQRCYWQEVNCRIGLPIQFARDRLGSHDSKILFYRILFFYFISVYLFGSRVHTVVRGVGKALLYPTSKRPLFFLPRLLFQLICVCFTVGGVQWTAPIYHILCEGERVHDLSSRLG